MPQTQAAKKALRVAGRRRVINDRWRKKYRTSLKTARAAVGKGETARARKLFVAAQSMIDRAAARNILHPNAAARKKSRLARALAKIGTTS